MGIVTSLPEIAITTSAALSGHLAVITGNLIGGIAIQTLLIVLFDFWVKGKRPLSYLAGSLMLVLEAFFVIVMTLLALGGTFWHGPLVLGRVNPVSISLLLAWICGLFIIYKARNNERLNYAPEDAFKGRSHKERRETYQHPFYSKKSNLYVLTLFFISGVAILIAGVFLEKTGTAIAGHIGMATGIFAGTVIALMSALPEISTGWESIRINDNALAISDIFGGNAFMPALFILADLLAAKSVLSAAAPADYVFGVMGISMTAIFLVAFIIRPKKSLLSLGADSWAVIAIYLIGLIIIGR